MRLLSTILSVLTYFLVITLLLFVNTAYFNQGDAKIGENGWTVYWYVWAFLYSPVFLFGVIQNWFKNKQLREYLKCNAVLVLLIAIFAEFSFIKKISWNFIIIEYLIIGIIWIYVLKLKMFLTKRFG